MFRWFREKLTPQPPLPDLGEWESACPDCGTGHRQLHDRFCLKETCPFCNGQLATCGCLKTVLRLSESESQCVDEYVDDATEPLATIIRRWREALDAKGRIPYRARPLAANADGLILAAAKGALPFVRAVLARGVPLDAANDVGYTALMCAARCYRVDVVKFLLGQGADVKLRHQDGYTALHWAVGSPRGRSIEAGEMQAECVRLLLKHGADVNDAEPHGTTPLMHAAWFGCRESIDVLLQAGADPAAKDDKGRTAADLATERGHGDIAERLRQLSTE